MTPHLDGPNRSLGTHSLNKSGNETESLPSNHQVLYACTSGACMQTHMGPFALATLLATSFRLLLLPIYTLVSDLG